MSDSYTRVLIVGHKGMLAQAIAEALRRRNVTLAGVDLPECDITREENVRRLFEDRRPTLLINCAAHTRVDACEAEEAKASAINGTAVGHLAEQARRYGTKLVHFSTDFVFDGNGKHPYRPDNAPNPVSAYGRTKLLGERLLAEHNPPEWLIVRTAWLYGRNGASFPRTIVERGRAGQPLKVVQDQVGSPTHTADLAAGVLDLVDHGAQGIFHLTNAGQTNWYELAKTTLAEFGIQSNVTPITAADWKKMRPESANRPAYSVLDMTAYEKLIGHPMRPWQLALRSFRDAVLEAGGF